MARGHGGRAYIAFGGRKYMVLLQGMKKERDESSVGYIIAERCEEPAPVITKRGGKRGVEIRNGQHHI